MTLAEGGQQQKVLCWLVVNNTLVVIKTSACNLETATGILKRQEPYLHHSHFWLNLGEGERRLHEACDQFYSAQEEAWIDEFWKEQSAVKDGAANSHSASVDQRLLFLCSVNFCFWIALSSTLMQFIVNALPWL